LYNQKLLIVHVSLTGLQIIISEQPDDMKWRKLLLKITLSVTV